MSILTENGVTHRTFTNAEEKYFFYGHVTGPATVKAGGVMRELPQLQQARNFVLELP